MRPLALKWRLSGLMAIALAVTIVVICITVYRETSDLLRKQMDQSLLAWARAADEIVAGSASAPNLSERLSLLLPPAGRHADTLARIWNEETGQVLHAATAPGVNWDAAISSLPKPPAGRSRFFSTSIAGRDYRGIWMRTTHNGATNIVIAQAIRSVESELREMLGDLTWIGAGVIVAMFGLVFLLVRAGLRRSTAPPASSRALTRGIWGGFKSAPQASLSNWRPLWNHCDKCSSGWTTPCDGRRRSSPTPPMSCGLL